MLRTTSARHSKSLHKSFGLKTLRIRLCRIGNVIPLKVDLQLPPVTRENLIGPLGSRQAQPQLLSHLERISSTAGAHAQFVSLVAFVENIIDQLVQPPRLGAASGSRPGKHLEVEPRLLG